MKKVYLLLLFAVAMGSLEAQTVFREHFAAATAGMNLEDYNDWYVCLKEADAMGVSPVIDDETLFYDNYIGSDIGKVAVLDSLVGKTDDTKRISTKVVTISGDTLTPTAAGTNMYAAFLISVMKDGHGNTRDFFTWEGSTTSNFSRGRVFAKTYADSEDVTFFVSKNSSSSGDLGDGITIAGGIEVHHLLVCKYEVIGEKAEDDVIKLYVNPDPTKSEAEQDPAMILSNMDTNSDYSMTQKMKINLRQRGIGAKIGNIRVGTNWEYLLQGDPNGIESTMSDAPVNSIYSYGQSIFTKAAGHVDVYDLTGRKVMSERTSGRIETNLTDGIYIVRFEDYTGNAVTSKVVLK